MDRYDVLNDRLKVDVATSARQNPGDMPAKRDVPIEMNRIESRDLFVATREITIGHGSETYRLRLTAQNKLILTK
jgi:hemin uptake protein HemP